MKNELAIGGQSPRELMTRIRNQRYEIARLRKAMRSPAFESGGKSRPEFLDAALACGAVLTGKPDGSEPVTVVFTIAAWRKFDAAVLRLCPTRSRGTLAAQVAGSLVKDKM